MSAIRIKEEECVLLLEIPGWCQTHFEPSKSKLFFFLIVSFFFEGVFLWWILFCDSRYESYFEIHGSLNKQNKRQRAIKGEHPRPFVEALPFPQKIMVWASISYEGIVVNMNEERYVNLLDTEFTSQTTMEYLHQHFGGRLIFLFFFFRLYSTSTSARDPSEEVSFKQSEYTAFPQFPSKFFLLGKSFVHFIRVCCNGH